MQAVVTKHLALKAILLGACSAAAKKIGMKITSLPTSDLIWAEERGLLNKKETSDITGNNLPLWVQSGYGYGYGSGYGYGYGYGYGSGYGDGYGYGYGSGYGDGYGYLSLIHISEPTRPY